MHVFSIILSLGFCVASTCLFDFTFISCLILKNLACIILDKLDHMIRKLPERIELDKLYNLHQGDLSFSDYIIRFEDLSRCCDVREHGSLTITRFDSGLRSDIRHAMITRSYSVDSVEEAFDFTLKIDVTFKRIVNAKV